MASPASELPAGFAAALDDERRSPAPRDSGSVLVLDGSTTPWRVLMMRRPGGSEFAPGAWVFPGGSVGPEDAGQPDGPRAAAVRELWEEVGLLLAWRRSGVRRRLATTADAFRLREAVESGLGFWPALEACGLVEAPERLVPLTRWITPSRVRRRFDTRFYAARAPRQEIMAAAGEVSAWRWVTAAEALAGGDGDLVYATRRILELVSPVPDAGTLLRRLRGRVERPPVQPRIVESAGRLTVVDDSAPLFR